MMMMTMMTHSFIQYANQSVVKLLTGGEALKLQDSEARFSTEFELELLATVLVGVLLLVSAVIAIFLLYRLKRSQDDQVRKTNKLYSSEMRNRISVAGRK